MSKAQLVINEITEILAAAPGPMSSRELFDASQRAEEQTDVSRAIYRMVNDGIIIDAGMRPVNDKGTGNRRPVKEYVLAERVEHIPDAQPAEPPPEPRKECADVTLEDVATGKYVSPLEMLYRRRVDAATEALESYASIALNSDPRYLALCDSQTQTIHDLYDVRLENGLVGEERDK